MIRSLEIRVIPKGSAEERTKFFAPDRQHYAEENIQDVIDKIIDYLDRKFPDQEFRMVRMKNKINFVYNGPRREYEAETIGNGMATPEISPGIRPSSGDRDGVGSGIGVREKTGGTEREG